MRWIKSADIMRQSALQGPPTRMRNVTRDGYDFLVEVAPKNTQTRCTTLHKCTRPPTCARYTSATQYKTHRAFCCMHHLGEREREEGSEGERPPTPPLTPNRRVQSPQNSAPQATTRPCGQERAPRLMQHVTAPTSSRGDATAGSLSLFKQRLMTGGAEEMQGPGGCDVARPDQSMSTHPSWLRVFLHKYLA